MIYTHGAQPSLPSTLMLCVVMYFIVALLWAGKAALGAGRGVLRVAVLCATWSSTSIGMHVLNKSLAGNLKSAGIISVVQMFVAACVMCCTSFGKLKEVPGTQLRTWLIVPLFFAGMLTSSFYTFEYISLSLLTIVRNLTPLIALPAEMALMPVDKQPHVSSTTCGAFALTIVGAIVYCGNIELSKVGLAVAGANMLLAVCDRVVQRRLLTQDCKDMPSDVCTLMNNSLGMIPALGLACYRGELAAAARNVEQWAQPQVAILLLLSSIVGLGIGYFGFECQREVSATSFFVLQNATKLAVMGVGVAFFGDPLTRMTGLGMTVSIFGSAIYGWSQVNALNVKAKKGDGKGHAAV